jgi:hypothetical protein
MKNNFYLRNALNKQKDISHEIPLLLKAKKDDII